MKLLKNLVKILQVIFLLIPFFMILYWIFIVSNFVPGMALFQPLFNPYIMFVRTFSNASTQVNGKVIDMVPVVAAFSVLIYYFAAVLVYKILDLTENAVSHTKNSYAKQRDKFYQAKMESNFQSELKKFDTNILILEFDVRRTNAFYSADPKTASIMSDEIKDYVQKLATDVKNYNGVLKSVKNADTKFIYVFTLKDIESIIRFVSYIKTKVKYKEKEFFEAGGKIFFKGVVNSCEEQRYPTEVGYSEQILKVTNDFEICTTEIVNSKFKYLPRKSDVTLYPKGGYQLGGKTFEIFQMNFSY